MGLKEHWASWAEVNGILHKRYDDWLSNPHRIYHCIFCGDHGNLTHFTYSLPHLEHEIVYCTRCKEYKGVEPCVEDYCECWQLDLLRKLKEQEAHNA